MKKKLTALFLSLLIVAGLSSCNGGKQVPTGSSGTTTPTATTAVQPTTTTASTTPTATTSAVPSTTNSGNTGGNATTSTTTTPTPKYEVIEEVKKEIPTELTFTGEDLNALTATIDCSNINVGEYQINFMNRSSYLDGVNVMAYRCGHSGNYTVIYPDSYLFKDTLYHGNEGAIFNSSALTNISSLEVTYKASDSHGEANPVKPNVTFGDSLECDDYLYYLDPASTDNTVTINVNNSGFKYFSINTGNYTTNVSNITVKCESKSGEDTPAKASSGEGKYRVNPVTLDKSKLVPGQTKITLPTNIAYDSVTKTYSATESKTLTYYTLDFVQTHPSVVKDATITDPMEVCMYYTTFGTWPANYGMNVNSVKAVFGNDTRKVSRYSRTDGYATSVPYSNAGDFVYYELDINYDGKYSTGSRGTGRVVAWDLGFSTAGYTKAPVCLYTDDHYNTWLEYYNNGTWSNRYNAEGVITGVKYSAPKIVELSNYDYNIIGGDPNNPIPAETGITDDVNTTTDLTAEDLLHYANFAPLDIFNLKTASFQQVTNMRGIIEGAKYVIAYKTNDEWAKVANNFNNMVFDGDNLVPGSEGYNNLEVFGFEKVNGNEYRLYKMKYDETNKEYLQAQAKSGKDLVYGNGTFNIGFVDGNFVLASGSLTLQYNNSNGGYFRMYTAGSQDSVKLYRLCDAYTPSDLVNNPDITTDETSRYRKATSAESLFDGGKYLIVSNSNKLCLTDDSNKLYTQAFDELYTDSDTYFDLFLTKHETENTYSLHYLELDDITISYIGVEDNQILYGSETPVYFSVTFDENGNVVIKRDGYVLGFGEKGFDFYLESEEVEALQLYRLCGNKEINPVPPEDPNMPEDSVIYDYVKSVSEISEEKEYVIADKNSKVIFKNYGITTYVSKTNKLAVPEELFKDGGFNCVLHIVKHEIYDVYSIYWYGEEHIFNEETWEIEIITKKRYLFVETDSNYCDYSDEPISYFTINIRENGTLEIQPYSITESGLEPITWYDIHTYFVRNGYYGEGYEFNRDDENSLLYLYDVTSQKEE